MRLALVPAAACRHTNRGAFHCQTPAAPAAPAEDPRKTRRTWGELLQPVVQGLSLEPDVSHVAEVRRRRGWCGRGGGSGATDEDFKRLLASQPQRIVMSHALPELLVTAPSLPLVAIHSPYRRPPPPPPLPCPAPFSCSTLRMRGTS